MSPPPQFQQSLNRRSHLHRSHHLHRRRRTHKPPHRHATPYFRRHIQRYSKRTPGWHNNTSLPPPLCPTTKSRAGRCPWHHGCGRLKRGILSRDRARPSYRPIHHRHATLYFRRHIQRHSKVTPGWHHNTSLPQLLCPTTKPHSGRCPWHHGCGRLTR
jgi:hypothetical protein